MFSVQSIKDRLIKFLGGYTKKEYLLRPLDVLTPFPISSEHYDIITLHATATFDMDSLPDRSHVVPVDRLKDAITFNLSNQLSQYIRYKGSEPGEDVFYHEYRLTGTIDIVDKH